MRPAQKAPENISAEPTRRSRSAGFNEAGAKSAGKLSAARPADLGRALSAGFNEAGAKSAGKRSVLIAVSGSFCRASMRPAQKAPENISAEPTRRSRSAGFNEAGAKSAGKQSLSAP